MTVRLYINCEYMYLIRFSFSFFQLWTPLWWVLVFVPYTLQSWLFVFLKFLTSISSLFEFVREALSHHVLRVSVSDGLWRDYCHVSIIVGDHNDHSPVFARPEYNITVPETAAIGTSVIQISASDADAGANGHVTYTIVAGQCIFGFLCRRKHVACTVVKVNDAWFPLL